MKRNKKNLFAGIIIFTLAMAVLASFATVTLAQGTDTSEYHLLAPLPGIEKFDTTQPNAFGTYFNLIFKVIIGLCAGMAVIMIVIAGIEYMTSEAVSGKSAAKGRLTNAVLGLFIALGSYAILFTVNPDILNTEVKVNQVNIEIDPSYVVADLPAGQSQAPDANGLVCNGEYKPGNPWPPAGTGTGNNNDLEGPTRTYLSQKGITINKDSCTEVGKKTPGCTSVFGLMTSDVVSLKAKCDSWANANLGKACDIQITGGTECWFHGPNSKKVHMPGGNVVDLHESQTLKAYAQSGKKIMIKWIGNNESPMYVVDGMKLVDETDHYHVYSY